LEEVRIKKKIPNILERQYYYNYLYFRSGLYYQQVKRYVELFKDNVLVLDFDDLKEATQRTYAEVCDFVGIKANEQDVKPYNTSKSVYSAKLQYGLRVIADGVDRLNRRLLKESEGSKRKRDALLQWGIRMHAAPPMEPFIRKELLKRFEVDIVGVSNLTGKEFYKWLSR
jgi:hypothetical protein